MTVIIDKDTLDGLSQPFEVPAGEQRMVVAYGLADPDDEVAFELVKLSKFAPAPCQCPPGRVQLPAVIWWASLRCCGEPIRLTAEQPYVVIDNPQEILIRARLTLGGETLPEDVEVHLQTVAVSNLNDRMRGCPC